jgi:RNA-directed DNA polymerase
MTPLQRLQAATSLHDVAAILKYEPKGLAYILYVHPKATLYTQFDIPKRTGGTRTIKAPYGGLKALQRKLCETLQECVDEIDKDQKSTISHGFKPGYSIRTNALPHRDRRFVLNVDIEDFFGTINFGRVRGFFIKNKRFSLKPDVATIQAQIACHDNALPQGGPSSPIVSNLIAHVLDIRLARLAQTYGLTYSRYADDLTFSTNKKEFPPQIAAPVSVDEHRWEAGPELEGVVNSASFRLNHDKTRMQYRDSRQQVTGLVVNAKVNVRAEYRRLARAMAHRLLTTGSFQHHGVTYAMGVPVPTVIDGKPDELNGMLSFINYIDRKNSLANGKIVPANLDKKEQVYRKFLFFRDFHVNPQPVILCEGKTDNVYIKAAIKRLASFYPDLADVDVTGKVTLKVRIYRYSDTNAGRIMRLTGGTGPLNAFITNYDAECKEFIAPGGMNPVIILVDNDSGAKSIYSSVHQVTKSHPDGTAAHYFISRNLYLVPTPGKDSTIEKFFQPSVLKTKLNGKSFDPAGDSDTATTYGKKIFAEHVKAHQSSIDFDGFRAILDRFVGVMKAHSAKLVP